MMTAIDELRWALARTALLVQRDFFPELTQHQIADGLSAITVRIVSDTGNAQSAAAQTAIVATAIVLAQSGAGVVLDLPDIPLVGPQPPLLPGATNLSDALTSHLQRLPAHQVARPMLSAPDVVVVIGDTPLAPQIGDVTVFRTTGDGWSTSVVANPEPLRRWSGAQPFGGVLAASGIGSEAFRIAMRKLAERHGIRPLPEHRLTTSSSIHLGVPPIYSLPEARRRVDFVSGGAITNAAIFTLQRVAGLPVDARVFDDDTVQVSNLNRYPLFTLEHVGDDKVEVLADASPAGWSIEAVPMRLVDSTIQRAKPLAPQVLVGVDDIPSRWLIQRHTTDWLCVAGTGHFEVVVSEHTPGIPCAGCMHPKDEPGNDPIPTVAFVSLLAGALQAHRLVARVAGIRPSAPVVAWALGLDGEHGIHPIGQSPRDDCPVGCQASAELAAGNPDEMAGGLAIRVGHVARCSRQFLSGSASLALRYRYATNRHSRPALTQ